MNELFEENAISADERGDERCLCLAAMLVANRSTHALQKFTGDIRSDTD